MKTTLGILICAQIYCVLEASIPIVINTWAFTHATEKAWSIIENEGDAIDALTVGCSTCETDQCDYTVGFGGSPDENGESTLDALIFDGATMDMGAVGGLRRIKEAINVARHVLDLTEHSFIVGDLATAFAKNLKFKERSLSTNYSTKLWKTWKKNSCQPNFWRNVRPNPRSNCGPYSRDVNNNDDIINKRKNYFGIGNHDTIGMIVIDQTGRVVAGTSTNGAKYKIPGRVGDSPIPGAGAYADNEVGAAVATGDGDVMMRFLPSFLAVEQMRQGLAPTEAAQIAIDRIARKYPDFFGAVLATTKEGIIGAACHGMDVFPFSVASNNANGVKIHNIRCGQQQDLYN